jgi:hypothetical protein
LKLKRKLTFGHPQNGHFYVAHVARFSQVISTAPKELRRLHATWMRHTAVSFPHNAARRRPHLQCLRILVIRSAEIHRLEVFAPVRVETLKRLADRRRTFRALRIPVIRSAEIHRLEVFVPVRVETLKRLADRRRTFRALRIPVIRSARNLKCTVVDCVRAAVGSPIAPSCVPSLVADRGRLRFGLRVGVCR